MENSIKKTLAVMIIAVMCILVSAGGAEIYLRTRHNDPFNTYRIWGHKKSIISGMEAKPNNVWKNAGATYSTDEYGFRMHTSDKDWNHKKGIKYFVLGASSAFGYGLNDDETWPELLESKLREDLKFNSLPYIINSANNMHNSLQTLIRFYLKVLPMNPDYIIFYEANNDVNTKKLAQDEVWITEDMLFSGSMVEYYDRTRQNEPFYKRYILYDVMNEKISSLMKYMPQWISIKGNEDKRKKLTNNAEAYLTDEQREIQRQNGRRFINNVETIAFLSQKYGVKMVVVTFICDHENVGLYYSSSIRYYNQLLRQLISKHKEISLIDMEKDFETIPDKMSYFFEDHYHPSKKGAQWIAGTIASHMLKNYLWRKS